MFAVNETESRFELTMSATLEGIDQADDRLAAYLQAHNVPVDVFGLRILLREAMLNAVTHGSGKDPNKSVALTVYLGTADITMTVEDSGEGFAWASRNPGFETLDGDGGRGLALMGIYADELKFNEQGNRVVLKKKLRDPVPSGSSAGNQEIRE